MSKQEELQNFALQLANAAAEQIMSHYLKCVVSTKPDGTEVTDADRHAEAVIQEMIAKQFPEDSVLGEEFGATHELETKYQWVIDPLDGTTWFTLGVRTFGTLIALLEDGYPILGVIHFVWRKNNGKQQRDQQSSRHRSHRRHVLHLVWPSSS